MQETADKLFGSRSLQVDKSKLGTMGSSMILLQGFSPYLHYMAWFFTTYIEMDSSYKKQKGC